MDRNLHERLRDLLPRDAIDPRKGVVTPGTAAEAAAVCRVCSAAGAPIAVCSGPPGERRAPDGGVLVSLARLDALDVAEERLVCRAGAGVPVERLFAALQSRGLRIAAPVRSKGTMPRHVGTLVAEGWLPRRALCGTEAVLASGETIRHGGEVLKDVAGYDLSALLLGSRGRLGLITAVVVRLLPAGAPLPAETGVPEGTVGAFTAVVQRAFDPGGLLRPLGSG